MNDICMVPNGFRCKFCIQQCKWDFVARQKVYIGNRHLENVGMYYRVLVFQNRLNIKLGT